MAALATAANYGRAAILTVAVILIPHPVPASVLGTTVTGCVNVLLDSQAGMGTSCSDGLFDDSATVSNSVVEFESGETQSGILSADFTEIGEMSFLTIGLLNDTGFTTGLNPSVWEFTGVSWGGIGVIDSLVLLTDPPIEILNFSVGADGTSILINAARISDVEPNRFVSAQFKFTGQHSPIPEPTTILLLGLGLAGLGFTRRRLH